MNTPKKKNPFRNFFYDFVKITGIIPGLIWMRPKVYNPYGTKIPRKGVLISSNHPTFLDPLTLLATITSRRLSFLVTKDLYKNGLMTFFLDRVNCIRVDKDNFALSAFHAVVEGLKDGKAVVIFPGGQVARDEKAEMAFRSGAVLMAHRAGCPILPVYIVKRTRWYERHRVVIGKPIVPGDYIEKVPSMQDYDRLTKIVESKERELAEYFCSLPIYRKLNQKG